MSSSQQIFKSSNSNYPNNQYGSEYSTPSNENHGSSTSNTYCSTGDANQYASSQNSSATQYSSTNEPSSYNVSYQSSPPQANAYQTTSLTNNKNSFYSSTQQAHYAQRKREPELKCKIL